MHPSRFFRYCPRCGRAQTPPEGDAPFLCSGCGFRYYFNAGAAVAAFITRPDGKWLFIRRAKDPGKGLLAPAGGFVNIGETAEAAVERELQEELGVTLRNVRFLCSHPNFYLYGGITYPTLDLFFTATLADGSNPQPLEEVSSVAWHAASEVGPADLAFDSMRAAWALLTAKQD
jgi:NADH pyrophosphatase NudC (nudix superfamily)